MALTTCHECNAKVSDDAKTCPSCGAKQKKPTSRITLALAGIFAIAVANTVVTRSSTPSAPTQPAIAETKPQAAIPVVDAEPEKLTKEDIKKKNEINRNIDIAKREMHAQRTEKNYLDSGMDVHVTLHGKDKTSIKLTYVLMSRPLAHQLSNDNSLISGMKNLGFKKMILSDGYKSLWEIDL